VALACTGGFVLLHQWERSGLAPEPAGIDRFAQR
jgi:hypothetical protein